MKCDKDGNAIFTPEKILSSLQQGGDINGCVIEGDFCLNNITLEKINFHGVTLKGNLDLRMVKVDYINLVHTTIEGYLLMNHLIIKHDLCLIGSKVKGDRISNNPFIALQLFLAFGPPVHCDFCKFAELISF